MNSFLSIWFTGWSEITAPLIICVTLLVSGCFAYKRAWDRLCGFLIPIIVTFSFCQIFKMTVLEERPIGHSAFGFSFPSEHAAMSMATALGVWHSMRFAPSRLLWLLLFPLFIGLSRWYLREHYVHDVLAGYSIALFSFLIYRDVKPYPVEIFE